jgi:hypothetical protein
MSFSSWKEYFEKNKSHFSEIDWAVNDRLTPEEKNCIAESIAQFQKGESSEGKHLFGHAKKYPDPEYLECIKLFIQEEQMHAKVLGQFMDKNKIPRIKKHWVDGIFRWLRKLAGMENTIVVLVTAEIIAKIYYNALKHATTSELLKTICTQILKDEDQHISFQCYTIFKLAEKKKNLGRIIRQTWHLILMLGTIMVVWMTHHEVLKKGGYYFSRFWLETLLVFFETDRAIKNRDLRTNYVSLSNLLRSK